MKAILCGVILAVALAAPVKASAIPGPEWNYLSMPELSPEQKQKLEDMRFDFLRFVNPRQGKLEQKIAELGVLLSTDKPDLAAARAISQEAATVLGEIQSRHVELLLAVKAILNKPAQIKLFNTYALTSPTQSLMDIWSFWGLPGGQQQGSRGGGGGQGAGQGGPGVAGGQPNPSPAGPEPAPGGPMPQGQGGQVPPCMGQQGPCQLPCGGPAQADQGKGKKK